MEARNLGNANRLSRSKIYDDLQGESRTNDRLQYAGKLVVTSANNSSIIKVIVSLFVVAAVYTAIPSLVYRTMFFLGVLPIVYVLPTIFGPSKCQYKFTDAEGEVSEGEINLLKCIPRDSGYRERQVWRNRSICVVKTNLNEVLARSELTTPRKKMFRPNLPQIGDTFKVYLRVSLTNDSRDALILGCTFGRYFSLPTTDLET